MNVLDFDLSCWENEMYEIWPSDMPEAIQLVEETTKVVALTMVV